MLNQNSIPIPVEIADVEIAKFISLRDEGAEFLLEKFIDNPEKTTFHGSKHNSFIFDRKDILRFFLNEGDITETAPEGKAEYLMVILGAHPGVEAIELEEYHPHEAKFPKGKPTVLVAGVNYTGLLPDEKQYSLLNLRNPVVEYPTGKTVTKLYSEEGNSDIKMLFTFDLE